MNNSSNRLLCRCVEFVQRAALNGLDLDASYRSRTVRGGQTHVGSIDLENSALAEEVFSEFGMPIIIEERKPKGSDWKEGNGAVFVDPIDGSAEIGTGGAQFSAGVSVYDANGRSICGAAASPGIRPIYRIEQHSNERGFTFGGFGGEMGAIVFGGPEELRLMPLKNSEISKSICVPAIAGRRLSENHYTSISLDPNCGSICGFQKGLPGASAAIYRMPFSNIFAQMQLVLGQADVASIGPTPSQLVGGYLRGSKAWDLMLPLLTGAGIRAYTFEESETQELTFLDRSLFDDGFVFRKRIYMTSPEFHIEKIVETMKMFVPAPLKQNQNK